MNTDNIRVVSDRVISSVDEVKIHFTYTDKLTLKELAETFDLTNKAINDINRDNGVGSNANIGKKYTTEVMGVEHGSIVLYIATNLVLPVALSVLASYIYDRLEKRNTKKIKEDVNQQKCSPIIIVNGDDNTIDIRIGSSTEH